MNPKAELTAAQVKRTRQLLVLGRLATLVCVAMYIAYIPQIMANFSGHPVSPLQPLAAMCNASLWTAYGWLKPRKEWPIIISNVPGIFFGLVTVLTVYVH